MSFPNQMRGWITRNLRFTAFQIAVVISLFFSALILGVTGHDRHRGQLGFLAAGNILRDVEYRLYDQKFRWRGPREPPSTVAIASIDEKSIAEIGRWPWPRTKMAELITKLDGLGAKAIALDIVFSEPDQLGVFGLLSEIVERLDRIPRLDPQLEETKAQLIAIQGQWQLLAHASGVDAEQRQKIANLHALQGKAVDLLLDELGKQKEREAALIEFEAYVRAERERVNADRILAEAILKSGRVVLGYYFLKPEEMSGLSQERYTNFKTLESSKISAFYNTSRPEVAIRNLQTPVYEGVGTNIEEIAGAQSQQGFFNAQADSDQIYRRTPLLVSIAGNLYPSLGLLAVQTFFREQEGEDIIVPSFLGDEAGLESVRLSHGIVKTDSRGQVFYNWYGPPGTVSTLSVVDILRDEVAPEKVRDKLILVGSTALAIADLRSAPVGENFPGVEMQATIVANIVENSYITRPWQIYLFEGVLVLLGGTALGWWVGRVRPLMGFLMSVAVLGGIYLLDYYLFFRAFHLWFRPVIPSLAFATIWGGVTLKGFIAEEMSKRQIKRSFEVYVNPAIVGQILESPDKFRLGGERRELSVLFSDIRGFTQISERLAPEALVHFLNDYLTPMTETIFTYDGTVDKYIGDAIMAFWGAPLSLPDHAKRACHCALDMVGALQELQRGWQQQGLPLLEMGIGINTGEMVVGNMGSREKFNYTVMGDEVNLASRLEGLTKEYGAGVIIGSKTALQVREDFIIRPLDRVRVKGKVNAEEIFEVMGRRNSLKLHEREREGLLSEIADLFAKGLKAYWARHWNEAQVFFEQVVEKKGEDRASRFFMQQIEFYRENAPESGWDGVRVMATK